MPAALSFEEAAVFPVSYATAWHALVDRARLQVGESLLVLGAGGATGYAAVQIGKHHGARVLATASSEAKRALAVGGADYSSTDARAEAWRARGKAENGDRGDCVGLDPSTGRTACATNEAQAV